ncbi:MAG: metallophosphoesterase [Eubacteriales bacterium]
MALWAIADLHLSTAANKPMDKFGPRWQGYAEKIAKRWNALVDDGDTVVIPGDISWAMKLGEARGDFEFIEKLNGRKIIGKGNHDYWWDGESKIMSAFSEWGVRSVSVLRNNAYFAENRIICGSRGWFVEKRLQDAKFTSDYEKMINRECVRLSLSLDEGERLRRECGEDVPVFVFLHFPPVFEDFVCEPIVNLLRERNVERCFFGHIHSKYTIPSIFEYKGIKMEIISSDYLDFYPKKLV